LTENKMSAHDHPTMVTYL